VWRETKAVYAAQQDRIVAQHATLHFDLEIGDDDEVGIDDPSLCVCPRPLDGPCSLCSFCWLCLCVGGVGVQGAAVRIGDRELLLDASPQSLQVLYLAIPRHHMPVSPSVRLTCALRCVVLQAWGHFCRGTIDTWKGIAAVAVGFALTAAAAATAAALLS